MLHNFTSEDQIETWAERVMDRLDRMFLTGDLDQSGYDDAVYALDGEAMQMIKALQPAPFKEDWLHYQ